MSAATPERKWALTKLVAGDYLLPSNDRKTLWRIQSYVDGPSGGLDWPRDKTVWRALRWPGDPESGLEAVRDELGGGEDFYCCPDGWEEVCACLPTRREAIARALSQPEGER